MSFDHFDVNAFVNLARKINSDTADVEVKACAQGFSKDIVETLSAFANCSGGVIICGLSEKEGFVPAKNFNAKKISETFSQACADKMEPPIRATITVEEFEDSLIVLGKIPETKPYQKPCYVKNRGPYEGSFVRTGEGDRKLSRYEVDRLMEERQQPRYDAQIIGNAEISELDSELADEFLKRERALSPRVFASLSDEDALLSMGIVAKGTDKQLHPTLAGLMALGRHPQKYFPRANVTFAVFPGISKEELAKDGARFLDSRTIIGSIPVMVAETLVALRRNMKVTSYVEGGFRHDVFDYPELAVRELVANALMHRDYSPEGLGSQVQVNMYADRIEVINPGGLYGMVTVDNIATYGASSSRNQFLSRILESVPYPSGYSETGYVVENKGTGFAQVQAALKQQGLMPAKPSDSLSFFAVTVMKRRDGQTASSFDNTDKKETDKANDAPEIAKGNLVNNVFDSKSSTMKNAKMVDKIDNDEAILLNAVHEDGTISTSQAAKLLKTSSATAFRRIKNLVDKGVFVSAGRHGRSTHYRLA